MGNLDFYDRGADRPWLNPRLTNAAMVGYTTTGSARLWIRVWEPGKYWLLLSEQPIRADGIPLVTLEHDTPAAQIKLENGTLGPLNGRIEARELDFKEDLTTVFDLKGLKQGTYY
jgi:alkaline phosphatase D